MDRFDIIRLLRFLGFDNRNHAHPNSFFLENRGEAKDYFEDKFMTIVVYKRYISFGQAPWFPFSSLDAGKIIKIAQEQRDDPQRVHSLSGIHRR